MSRCRCADLATLSRGTVVMLKRCETVDQIRPRWFRWFVVFTWAAATLVYGCSWRSSWHSQAISSRFKGTSEMSGVLLFGISRTV
jgi:hypothetical protein